MNLESAQIVAYRPKRLRSEVDTREVERRRRVWELGALGHSTAILASVIHLNVLLFGGIGFLFDCWRIN